MFNYWEPTHFLTHGFGLQTWEYSPEYAIRSWAYVALHAALINAVSALTDVANGFFILRYVYAIASAAIETKLYLELASSYLFGGDVALFYALFSGLSTGLQHAGVAYLPSSFAMHTFTLSLAYLVRYVSKPNQRHESIVKGLLCIVEGSFLGWPFLLALAPLWGLHYLLTSLSSVFGQYDPSKFFKSVVTVALGSLILLAVIVGVDLVAYRKLEIVPLNIVLYNVINTSEDSGPDIFGTEPWWYYVLNLALNFNIAWPLALLSLVCAPMRVFLRAKQSIALLSIVLLPLYIWLGIFTAQPHKEERFMYIIYGALCLNAAVTVDTLSIALRKLPLPQITSTLFKYAIVIVFALLSLSRSMALANYYGAPVDVFAQLQDITEPVPNGNVCIGREWYRFPSSYFLDTSASSSLRLKFIESGFTGLLPGEFLEPKEGTNWWNLEGTSAIPTGMNNKNLQDKGKYVSLAECDYVVDADFDVAENEVKFTQDSENWEKLYCTPFLDTGASKGLARILYLPEALHSVMKSKLEWTDYCLMERRQKRL